MICMNCGMAGGTLDNHFCPYCWAEIDGGVNWNDTAHVGEARAGQCEEEEEGAAWKRGPSDDW